jgi:predicted nucleic acid-binding protein
MILVADSSALIALAVVDQLEVLEKLFGTVYVPRAVYDEISRANKAESRRLSEFCRDKVIDIQSHVEFNISLGRGESEAIALYSELDADFLLCDDKKAKRFAQSFGLNVIGSMGILLKAKATGYIDAVAPLIEILRSSNVFIDDRTCMLVLKMAGEER